MSETPTEARKPMELFIAIAIIAVWLALQLWILPWFGVST